MEAKQYSLEVDKLHSKIVKDKLKQLNLLDAQRKITTHNDCIRIPLTHELDTQTIQTISTNQDQYPNTYIPLLTICTTILVAMVEDTTKQQSSKQVSLSPIDKIVNTLQKDPRFTKLVSHVIEIVLEITMDRDEPRESWLIAIHCDLQYNLQSHLMTEQILDQLPRKWEKLGHVVILKKAHLPEESVGWTHDMEITFSEALVEAIGSSVDTVVVDEEGVQGELRQPGSVRLVFNRSNQHDPLETIHVENGVKYQVHVGKVMFSSGNGTERIHFGKDVILSGQEIVVDMFAGIGYFSVPLALNNRFVQLPVKDKKEEPRPTQNKIISLEKNPDSYRLLCANVQLNGVASWVTPVLGDNREIANEYLGKADKILMGYIPTPKQFLARAFDFLKPTGGIDEYKTLAELHVKEELDAWSKQKNVNKVFSIVDFRVVKSYSPKQFHCVADVKIE